MRSRRKAAVKRRPRAKAAPRTAAASDIVAEALSGAEDETLPESASGDAALERFARIGGHAED